ncbi:hypothetical protein F5Y17DRAFT_418229 [Xylariaceae sp. FL0594]|nr:hypothetical protein F5Y17DRAFT_418229 [Xylariaceae sp. FL0594]
MSYEPNMATWTQDVRQVDSFDVAHAQNLHDTLQELEALVKEHEHVLQRLRADPAVRVAGGRDGPPTASLDIMKMAYDELAFTTPTLPSPDSVLPALVALRRTHQAVEETKDFLLTQNKSLEETKKQLETAKADFSNQQALAHSLRVRIQSLQDGLETRMEMSPEDIAREKIDELKQKKKKYDREAAKLMRSLKKFIDSHLGAMLAAEDLGGPVVGEMMDIDQDDLAAGFNSQGRVKTAKAKAKVRDGDEDKRQRRIDEIWGSGEPGEAHGGAREGHDRSEIAAAAQEMRDLTEELLNSLSHAEGDSSAAYVHLPKESAAARFLVRAKVAQFHPKDSSRLRLIDFGRELDE